MTAVGLVAAIGRERLDLFEKSARVVDSLGLAAPLIVVGWLVAIAIFGGYRRHAFGAGSDEFKSVVNASLVAHGPGRDRLLPGSIPLVTGLLPHRLRAWGSRRWSSDDSCSAARSTRPGAGDPCCSGS